MKTSKIEVSGGTFTSASGVSAVQTVPQNPTDTSRVSVSGGTFSSDISAYLPNDLAQDANGEVGSLESNAAAKIGNDVLPHASGCY